MARPMMARDRVGFQSSDRPLMDYGLLLSCVGSRGRNAGR